MFSTTKTAVLVWLLCCYHFTVHDATQQHQQKKNSSASNSPASHQRSLDKATVGDHHTGQDGIANSKTAASTKPRPNAFQSLLRSSMDVVQRGMDTFQGVTSSAFKVARILVKDPGKSAEPRKRSVPGNKKHSEFIGGLGKSVASMINTGVTRMEQATDLGLVLGKIGASKIRSEIDGTDGNDEIIQILVKYVVSRIGKSTKGSADQFIDDVGSISTFIADDDDVTKSISLIMKKLMENEKVSAAVVRMTVSVLESSPSTSCLLEQLPLKAADIRMLFNVFVGSNGQLMISTLADLIKDMTTGPDTKEFLQSILGMMSMFKSDNPAIPDSEPGKPTSVAGTLASFFIGDSNEENNDAPEPPNAVVDKKKARNGGNTKTPGDGPKKSKQIQKLSQEDEDWFTSSDDSAETVTKSIPKTPVHGEGGHKDTTAETDVKSFRTKTQTDGAASSSPEM